MLKVPVVLDCAFHLIYRCIEDTGKNDYTSYFGTLCVAVIALKNKKHVKKWKFL